MKNYFPNRCLVAQIFTLIIAISGVGEVHSESLQITQVSATPKIIHLKKHDAALIRFHVNKPASVCTKIFDARDMLVWRECSKNLPAGTHQMQWPVTAENGQPARPEAYFYVVEATTDAGEKSVYDLTDVTGGETLRIDNANYDSKKKMVILTAPKLGRYFIRAGISQSFAVNTLINNELLTEGRQEIRWDGFDASHVFSVAEHPNLLVGGFGYGLSENAIVVQNDDSLNAENARKKRWDAAPPSAERREKVKSQRADIDPGFNRSVERNRDVVLKLVLPPTIQKSKIGLPIIQGATPVRVELSAEDAEIMEIQRGEMVFFWDSQLIYDNEVSYYPYTFNWNPPILDGKPHMLTAVVVGFGGNIALATIEVQLGREQAK